MCDTKIIRKKCLRNGCNNLAKKNGNLFCNTKCRRNHIASENARLRSMGLPEIGYKKPKSKCKNTGCQNLVRTNQNIFCSKKCTKEYRLKLRPVRHCRECSREITGRNTKFCSTTCWSSSNIKKKKKCFNDNCQNILGIAERKFCSKKCISEHRFFSKRKTCLHCNGQLSNRQITLGAKSCSYTCSNAYKKINSRKVGDIFIQKDRGIPKRFIKINDKKYHNQILLSKYTWEIHNGKLPIVMKVAFKDGNRFNDQDINNLEIVSCFVKIKEV